MYRVNSILDKKNRDGKNPKFPRTDGRFQINSICCTDGLKVVNQEETCAQICHEHKSEKNHAFQFTGCV